MNDHPDKLGPVPGHFPQEAADRPLFAVMRALLALSIIGTLLFFLH